MWCIPKLTAEFVRRMYDLLDLYLLPYNSEKPLICVDEKSKQLIEDTRSPIPMKSGSPQKIDYEYKRNGTANIFVAVEPKGGRRVTQVTDRRTKKDFALFMRDIADIEYPNVKKIICVLDNLNTHFESSFYETFDEAEAKRIFSRFEFHYTPKHASWLDAAEIEIGVMDHQCTDKRIKDKNTLIAEVAAWTQRRNNQKKMINWSFTKEKADAKLSKHYVT